MTDELEESLRQLVQEKKISVTTKDGEDYYFITEEGINYIKNRVLKDFKFACQAFSFFYMLNRKRNESPEQALISATQIMCKLDPEFPDKLFLPRE